MYICIFRIPVKSAVPEAHRNLENYRTVAIRPASHGLLGVSLLAKLQEVCTLEAIPYCGIGAVNFQVIVHIYRWTNPASGAWSAMYSYPRSTTGLPSSFPTSF
jgi:hypothetical protein